MNELRTLEFLVPSYKRPQTLIKCVNSIDNQVQKFGLEKRVKVTVVDDCSPDINTTEIIDKISPFSGFVTFRQNNLNKGMSLNIRDMVANSTAEFCTILTDDDSLQPNSLESIIETLDTFSKNQEDTMIGSFFVPRYSYLEDQTLHCIVCNPFQQDKLIRRSPLNSLRYLHNGFILTGLFFNPKLINFKLWDENIENGYFPVIYFADLLLKYDCFFIKKNWFIHTVLNECHWDTWGKTQQDRQLRLYNYYMKAVTISAQRALSIESGIVMKVYLLREEFRNYKRQMNAWSLTINPKVDKVTQSRFAYQVALIAFNIGRSLKMRVRLSPIKQIIIAFWKTFFETKIK